MKISKLQFSEPHPQIRYVVRALLVTDVHHMQQDAVEIEALNFCRVFSPFQPEYNASPYDTAERSVILS